MACPLCLLFTLISDWFLVIKGDHQLLAVVTFILLKGFMR